ncbi:MAG: hypothetical protein QF733_03285 [Phycisphaerales bacterium]|nr:hypothetical protein [Phycisphaerales bacterium]
MKQHLRIGILTLPALIMPLAHPAAARGDSPLAPDFLLQDAAIIIESAGVSEPDQQEVILQLLHDYDAQCEARRDMLDQAIRAAPQQGSEAGVVLGPLAATRAYLAQKAEDTQWLTDSLQLILTEAQLEGFEQALRTISRRRGLPQVEPPIGQIDLAELLRSRWQEDRDRWTPQVREILARWELDIAKSLADLESFDVSKGVPFRVMVQQEDWEGALAWRETWLKHHLGIRDLTRAAAMNLLPHLSDADAAFIEQEVVYGGRTFNSRTARLAGEAIERAATSADAQQARDILRQFQAEAEPTRRALIEAQLAAEGLQHLAPLQRRLGRPSKWEQMQQRQVELLTTLRAIDDRWADQLKPAG